MRRRFLGFLVIGVSAGAFMGAGLTGVAGAGLAPNQRVFDEPGNFSFEVPADVCEVNVEATGADGGAGGKRAVRRCRRARRIRHPDDPRRNAQHRGR